MAFTRVDITDDAGQAIAAKYGVRSVPTFIVVAPDGKVLYRKVGGTPDGDAVAKAVDSLAR